MLKTLALITALAGVALLAGTGTARADGGDGGDHCRRGVVVTIIGTGGPDVLVGGECPAYLYGLGGADRLIAGSRGDVLFGGRGNDRLRAVNGYADVLSGGRGRDVCRGDQLDLFKSCERVLRFYVTPAHDGRHR
jgi:Ca2+-binding RTX toxin-like protein